MASVQMWAAPESEPPGGKGWRDPFGEAPSEGEDLPYRVELMDHAGEVAEQVAAVSVSPAIGYAAYYAAIREHPGRIVVLRYRGRVLSRSGSPH
ncbi:MAG TPA: hypothetical protein VG248_02710 [Caulobacteraceae bacterium]|jgi:hypothetical protein|nr:hypothetical protein [Caulobacteraceae bacterium]